MRINSFKSFVAGTATGLTAFLAPASAEPITVDFNELVFNNNHTNAVGSSYNSKGFNFYSDGALGFGAFGTTSARYPGTPAIYNRTLTNTYVTYIGGAFSLPSISLVEMVQGATENVTLTGTRSDNSTVSITLQLDGDMSFAPQTFNLGFLFSDIRKLVIAQSGTGHQMDGFQFNASTNLPTRIALFDSLPQGSLMGSIADNDINFSKSGPGTLEIASEQGGSKVLKMNGTGSIDFSLNDPRFQFNSFKIDSEVAGSSFRLSVVDVNGVYHETGLFSGGVYNANDLYSLFNNRAFNENIVSASLFEASGNSFFIDNVNAAVPEPSAGCLLTSSVALTAGLYRNRKPAARSYLLSAV